MRRRRGSVRGSWRSDMLVLLGRTSGRQSREPSALMDGSHYFLVLLCYVVLPCRYRRMAIVRPANSGQAEG